MFNAGSLAMLLRMLAKPASGTQFVLTTTTKVSAAFTAVRNGQTTVEQLVVGQHGGQPVAVPKIHILTKRNRIPYVLTPQSEHSLTRDTQWVGGKPNNPCNESTARYERKQSSSLSN